MFIAFDGIDGAGKSTQVNLLKKYFDSKDISCTTLTLGGDSKFKKLIDDISLKNIRVPAEVREYLYYFEGLYTNLTKIKEKKKDEVILIDRYYLSYLSYGPLNGVPREDIADFVELLIEPDLYFYLDISSDDVYKRIKKYRKIDFAEVGFKNSQENKGLEAKTDFLSFQQRVKENFQAELKENHIIIDARRTTDEVHRKILKEINRGINSES